MVELMRPLWIRQIQCNQAERQSKCDSPLRGQSHLLCLVTKTFYSSRHIVIEDKKEYNNVALKIKYLYVHA